METEATTMAYLKRYSPTITEEMATRHGYKMVDMTPYKPQGFRSVTIEGMKPEDGSSSPKLIEINHNIEPNCTVIIDIEAGEILPIPISKLIVDQLMGKITLRLVDEGITHPCRPIASMVVHHRDVVALVCLTEGSVTTAVVTDKDVRGIGDLAFSEYGSELLHADRIRAAIDELLDGVKAK